jgi:D-alanine-D-alanine ligase-like ATP-grasp enzyme
MIYFYTILRKYDIVSPPEDVLKRSPVDFKSAIAYSLQEDVRRLIITFIAGLLFSSTGWSYFVYPELHVFDGLLDQTIGLVLLLIGIPLLIGGLVGSAFKIITDAFILAMKQ